MATHPLLMNICTLYLKPIYVPSRPHQSLNIYVPWNEVVVLDPVVMSRSHLESGLVGGNSHAASSSSSAKTSCDDHDFDLMKPLVLATWNHGFQVSTTSHKNRKGSPVWQG